MFVIIFIYGLIIGSFLNVVIYRIPRKENIAFPASHCPSCSTRLKWYDNIPLISYILLRGRCRYCDKEISLQYPIVESINGILYLILFKYFGFGIDFIFYALICSILIAIILIDLKEMIIPDSLVSSVLALSIIHRVILFIVYKTPLNIKSSILGLLIAGLLFLLIVIVSKGGMGGGDVTLIGVLGFVLGVPLILLNILLSFVLGGVISSLLLITKIKTRKDPIPFGPFIVLGFFIVLLYGEEIIDWYFNLLL